MNFVFSLTLRNPYKITLKCAIVSLKIRKVSSVSSKMLRGLVKSSRLLNINAQRCISYAAAKPFEDIPMPVNLPLIGNGYYMFKAENRDKTCNLYNKLIDELGPIYKVNFMGVKFLILGDPEDVRTLYQNEGPYPQYPTMSGIMGYQR